MHLRWQRGGVHHIGLPGVQVRTLWIALAIGCVAVQHPTALSWGIFNDRWHLKGVTAGCRDVFSVGVSHYGVADCELLAQARLSYQQKLITHPCC